jgi:uncharacterized protein
MAWADYAVMAAGLWLAYVIRGIVGFGSAMVAVPILSRYFPVAEVVPGVMLIDYVAALQLSWGKRSAEVDKQEILRLLPYSLVGCVTGVCLLATTDNALMMQALSAVVIVFGAYYAIKPDAIPVLSERWAPLAGFSGGATGAMFGVSAPPYIIYLAGRLRDVTALRSTFSFLARFDGAFRIVFMVILGLMLKLIVLKVFLLGMVCCVAGLWVGDKLHSRLPAQSAMRCVGGVIALLGVALLLNGRPPFI